MNQAGISVYPPDSLTAMYFLTGTGNNQTIQTLMEDSDFEIADVESLRPHYALTLRHWVNRLEQNYKQAVSLVGERTYRIWRLYMTMRHTV